MIHINLFTLPPDPQSLLFCSSLFNKFVGDKLVCVSFKVELTNTATLHCYSV